jgi:hypothetical protein
MPGIVKIGLTERDIETRVRELSSHTGVAAPYHEEARFEVCDPVEVEAQVHAALAAARVNPDREFFRISVQKAIDAVSKIISMPAIDFDSQRERAKQNEKG